MHSSTLIHRGLVMPLAFAGVLITSFLAGAQAPDTQPKPAAQTPSTQPKPAAQAPSSKPKPAATAPASAGERFTAKAVNLGAITGETITVDLIRWSTDAERDAIVATMKDKGAQETFAALQKSPNLGYIWRSGSGLGAFVRYAYKFKAADGEHVVVATDSDLNSWKQGPGKPAAEAAASLPFTLIEMVITPSGASAGKMSLAGKVVSDAEHKTLRLDGYAAAPAVLQGVKRAPARS
jgi:hypothetical protein